MRQIHAALGLGQEQHVGHHARQPLKFLGVRCQDVAVGCGIALGRQRHLGLGQQIADGSAQFVREVGREIGKALEVLLQPIQHAVQLLRQVGHFHRYGLHGHALAKLLPRHLGSP